jgi:hypothetical protein
MATADEYAQWIVDNADKKGTKEFANAKPCNDCEKRLSNYPFAVWYTNEDGIIEEL